MLLISGAFGIVGWRIRLLMSPIVDTAVSGIGASGFETLIISRTGRWKLYIKRFWPTVSMSICRVWAVAFCNFPPNGIPNFSSINRAMPLLAACLPSSRVCVTRVGITEKLQYITKIQYTFAEFEIVVDEEVVLEDNMKTEASNGAAAFRAERTGNPQESSRLIRGPTWDEKAN